MEDNVVTSLRGQLLIAMPGLADPNFFRTVTCISEHNEEGAVGIVINRVHPSITGGMIFKELGIQYDTKAQAIPVHIGGPVHMGTVFVLHGHPFGWEGSLMFSPYLAMSNTRDILEAVAQGKGPASYLISLGCAGWGPGQLENEIKSNAWLNCSLSEDIVFNVPVESRWEEAVKMLGIDPMLLSDNAGNA